GSAPEAGGPGYGEFLRSRPAAAEVTAIARVIELARRARARAHVLHLSAADATGLLADARRGGGPGPAATCPPHPPPPPPALPRLAGGGRPGRRRAVKGLPADPRARQPRAALGGAARRHHRLRGVRALAVPARAQAHRPRRLRRGLGRDRLGAGRAARGVDP